MKRNYSSSHDRLRGKVYLFAYIVDSQQVSVSSCLLSLVHATNKPTSSPASLPSGSSSVLSLAQVRITPELSLNCCFVEQRKFSAYLSSFKHKSTWVTSTQHSSSSSSASVWHVELLSEHFVLAQRQVSQIYQSLRMKLTDATVVLSEF